MGSMDGQFTMVKQGIIAIQQALIMVHNLHPEI